MGGGPAGLAAGLQLARAGYRTLLLEKDLIGGQARRIPRIENYPGVRKGVSGKELMKQLSAQAREWDLQVQRAEAREITCRRGVFSVRFPGGGGLRARSVVFCPGAVFDDLGIPGERLLRGRGVYHAAFKTASRFRGNAVAVVGGGETAVHQALLLSQYAGRVYLIYRGSKLKAHRLLCGRLRERPNIVPLSGKVVRRVLGKSSLDGIEVSGFGRGRRERTLLPVKGLFVLVGQKAAPAPFPVSRVPKGFFVAGDATGEIFRQVAVAAGGGMRAGMRCIRFLEGMKN